MYQKKFSIYSLYNTKRFGSYWSKIDITLYSLKGEITFFPGPLLNRDSEINNRNDRLIYR